MRSDGEKRRFSKMFEKPVRKYDRAWATVLHKTNNDAVRNELLTVSGLNVFTLGSFLFQALLMRTSIIK